MKRVWIVLLFLLVLSACEPEGRKEVWNFVENEELTADNGWAGVGLYCYEEHNVKYCDFMIYGSGVPVAGVSTSEVEFDENGDLVLQLPENLVFSCEESEPCELTDITFVYEDEQLMYGDYIFTNQDVDMRELSIEMDHYQYLTNRE